MAGDEAKFGQEAWDSSLDALTLQLKAIHELRQSFDPAYRAGRHADPNGKAMAQRAQDFLFGLARLQLDHFRQVIQFSNEHFDTVIEQLRRLGKLGEVLTGSEARIEVELRGKVGETVSGTFEIHNVRPKPAETRFISTEFVAEKSAVHASVPVTVTATRTSFGSVLEPYGLVTLRVSLTLDRAAFTAPGRYRGTTYVMDNDAVTGIVHLIVDVDGPGAAKRGRAGGKSPAPRRQRRTKRR